MLSIYSTAFNVIKNNFDYKDAVKNFCLFAQEVVISINKSDDDTWEAFEELKKTYGNLTTIPASVSYEDPCIDGKLFNLALQNTTQEFKILLGLDQRIPLRQRENWEQLAYSLRFASHDAYLIPVLDLWGSKSKIRWDPEANVSFQWFLHKDGLERGVVDFAQLPNGKFDPSKSDSSELIYPDGKLVKHEHYLQGGSPTNLKDYLLALEEQSVYVFHLGYMNFENRIKVNEDIWREQWEEIRPPEKRENAVALSVEELKKHPTFEHNLKLWHE